ncbi:zinc finger protein 568-like [Cimex lectularius]|uniref:C2H2-type domain-containing protein n=1 Tax=Cimex lectularius TaxID=79782 RepID=A0A8I6S7S4_CIMLE|nr:zinc finger protein 568-like [Cimex lectularius]
MSLEEKPMGQNEADPLLIKENHHNKQDDNEEVSHQESNLNTNYDSSDGAIPMHRCEGCDYEAMSRAALIRHNLTCCQQQQKKSDGDGGGEGRQTGKMFECDVCNMRFSNGANMRRHKMRHTGVKPYECRVCGKRFFRKDHLAEHTTTHAKSLPWSCPICQRGFQRQIAMRAHFQNEHVGGNGTSAEPKSCPLCSYKAASMKSLRVHFYNRHGIDLDKPSLSNGCGDRTVDNATPPMHFLTPHVEISTQGSPNQPQEMAEMETDVDQESPRGSPESGDSMTPSSSIAERVIKLEPQNVEGEEEYQENERNNTASPVNLSTRVSPLVRLLSRNEESLSDSKFRSELRQMVQIEPDTCGHCGIRFPDRTLYFLHKGCHAEGNPWKCNICGEQTRNVYDFNSHLLSKNHQ